MQNLGELILELCDLTGDDSHSIYPYPQKIRFLNNALQRLTTKIFKIRRDFYVNSTIIQTQSNNHLVALPEDSREQIAELKNSSNNHLYFNNFENFNIFDKGQPLQYDIIGKNLWLYPTPNSVYDLALVYYRIAQKMKNPTDVPFFPTGYEYLIVDYAALTGKLKTEDSIKDIAIRFSDGFKDLRDTLGTKQTWQPRGVTPVRPGPGNFFIPINSGHIG